MGQISFWQSAPFGVIIAAAITALSTWMLWWITRRRDELLESRRTRLEAGVQSLRAAHRVQIASDELVRAVAAIVASEEEHGEALAHLPDRYSDCLRAWGEAVRDLDEQLTLTRALASRDVSSALNSLAGGTSQSLENIVRSGVAGYDQVAAERHNQLVAELVRALAAAVRVDAQTDLGAKGTSRGTRWLGSLTRKA